LRHQRQALRGWRHAPGIGAGRADPLHRVMGKRGHRVRVRVCATITDGDRRSVSVQVRNWSSTLPLRRAVAGGAQLALAPTTGVVSPGGSPAGSATGAGRARRRARERLATERDLAHRARTRA